jgi:transposase
MAKPYSRDLRERVVERALAGESIRDVGARYGVSPSVVSKWSRRFRATGSVAPGQMGGHKPVILAAHRDFVHARFAEAPELTLRDLQKELAAKGIELSYGAIWAFVHAEGLSFKKNRPRRRAGSPGYRAAPGKVEEASGTD